MAENVRNTVTFEKSVLAAVTNAAFSKASQPSVYGLLGRTAAVPDIPTALVADHLDYFGLQVSSDDVVLRGGRCGQVVACLKDGNDLHVLVTCWRHISVVSEHSGRWMPTSVREVWHVASVALPLAWHPADGGAFVVVRM